MECARMFVMCRSRICGGVTCVDRLGNRHLHVISSGQIDRDKASVHIFHESLRFHSD